MALSGRGRLAAIAVLTLVAGVAALALVARYLLGEWLAGTFEGYDAVLPLPTQVTLITRSPVEIGLIAATVGLGAVAALVVAVRRRGHSDERRS